MLRFDHSSDSDDSGKELFRFYAICGIAFSVFYAIVQPLFHFTVPQWVFICNAIAVSGILLVYHTVRHYRLASHLLIASFWLSFTIGAYYSGKTFSFVVPWTSLMPVMANLLISKQQAKYWFIAPLITILAMALLDWQAAVLPWRPLFSNLGLTLMLFLFIRKYDKIKNNLLTNLEKLNLEIKESNDQISAQNEKISAQNEEISAQVDLLNEQLRVTQEQKNSISELNLLLKEKIQEITSRSSLLQKYWNALLNISKRKEIHFNDFEEGLKLICSEAAKAIEAHRVSIWEYSAEDNHIISLMCFHAEDNTFSKNEKLSARDFPIYINELEKLKPIIASEARTNPVTMSFNKNYIEPHGIFAMLDTPFFIRGALGGIVCCEQKYAKRIWLDEDILFAQALADIVTLVYHANERRSYERKIRENKRDVEKLNSSLEEEVLLRTEDLNHRNKQLSEYAFINAHTLRGPLCRILGLVELIDHFDHDQASFPELLNHLKRSALELDDVTRTINRVVSENRVQ